MNIQAKTSMMLDLVNAGNVLFDETDFKLTQEGLSFRGMDPSHIAMIDVQVPAKDFTKYEGIESEVRFALRTAEVAKILKRFEKDEELNLTLDGEHLVISNQGKTFKTRTLEATSNDSPLPKLKLETHTGIDRATFDKILGDIAIVSEYITLENKGGDFTAYGKGDSGEGTVSIGTASGENAKAIYSLGYISKMIKAVNAETIALQYSAKMPLKIVMGSWITYYLAPRVADD